MKKVTLFLWILLAAVTPQLLAQDAPISTIGVISSNTTSVIVPITATNFNNITSCQLKLHYDPAIATVTNDTDVTLGSMLAAAGGIINSNISTPGVITISWATAFGISIPNNAVAFNIRFSKVSSGTSDVTWNSFDMSNIYFGGSFQILNDSPFQNFYIPGSVTFGDYAPTTTASSVTSCPGMSVSVPVKVTNFNNIGAISLWLNYNPSVLSFESAVNDAGFPLFIDGTTTSGSIIIGGTAINGITYPANTTLITLNFTYLGGSTPLSWFDNGTSCEYGTNQPPNFEPLNDSPQSTYYIDGFVGPGDNTQWNGSLSTLWETQGNWSCGIPHSNSTVVIPNTTNKPVISGAVVLNSLTINNGAKLTLNPAASLTVNTTLINNAGTAGLLLKSSATATASLIHHNSGVNATVERYIAKYDVINDHMFHFLSSPVAAQSIRTEFVATTPIYGHDFYAFSEPQNMWINTKAGDGNWNTNFENNFIRGKAYLIAYPMDVVKSFTGVLNNYPAATPLMLNNTFTPGQGEGWNLLGNPFPSALDFNLLTLGNGIDNALYYYNNEEENYQYYLELPGIGGGYLGNGTQFIPPMQGFMVHAKSNVASTVSITNAARTHSGKNIYYKSGQSAPGSMKLTVSSNGHKDETFIHFNHQATAAFDGEYDAYKLKSYSTQVPKIYTKSADNSELAINGLPELSGYLTIPVYFEASVEGNYTLTANLEQFQGPQIYLEDKTLNIIQNMTANQVYSFSASPGEDANRFALNFGSLGMEDVDPAEEIKIYTVANNIVITSPESSKSEISVYNLVGQLMLRSNTNANQMTVIPAIHLQSGVYVVSVVNSGKIVNSKITISH